MKYTRLAISCDRLAAVCRGLLRRWGEIGGEFRNNTGASRRRTKTASKTFGNNKGASRLTNISSFHMLGNEPEILDFKFEDDPTLSL